MLDGLAILALAPAHQVVGRATGQILDRLDAVLAEMHKHFGRDPRHFLEGGVDAEPLAFGVEFDFLPGQKILRARLQLAGGFLIEALDPGDFLFIHDKQFFDGAKSFRSKQLTHNFVDIERFDEQFGPLLEFGLPMLRFLLLRKLPLNELPAYGTPLGEFLTDKMVEMASNSRFDPKKEEEAFKDTFNLLDAALESVPVALAALEGPNCIITYANRLFLSSFSTRRASN